MNWTVIRMLLVLMLVVSVLCCGRGARSRVDHLDHLVITVSNITRTRLFYVNVLGMEAGDDWGLTSVYFGRSKINIHQIGREFEPKAGYVTPGSADLCFVTQMNIEHFVKHLEKHDVPILLGPVVRPGARGAITSVYFRDPDQNLLEVGTY